MLRKPIVVLFISIVAFAFLGLAGSGQYENVEIVSNFRFGTWSIACFKNI